MNPSCLALEKSRCRAKLRQLIRAIPAGFRKAKSQKIIQKLIRLGVFRRSRKILAYVSLPDEVNTRVLIRRALGAKKRVFVPKVAPRKWHMDIYEISRWSDLRKGRYGILEPRARKSRKGDIAGLDLIIVPGLGFTRRGIRLGRGEGYYDRFLAKIRRTEKIGLAFREQILREIPHGRRDAAVDRLITD